MTPLVDDTVIIRWLEPDLVNAECWPGLYALLDASECERAARFRFERDRKAFVAAHAVTRCMLSRCVGANGPPADGWRFILGPHGKPEIDSACHAPPLRFNLSHTHGLVAVAITVGHEVGVDVEYLDAGRLGLDLAESIFTAMEVAHLRRLPAEPRTDASFALWTLKEAYVKATGLGLSAPVDAVDIVLDPLEIRFSPCIADDPSLWLFHSMRPTPHHMLALAVRHARRGTVFVDARAVDIYELDQSSVGPARVLPQIS